METAPAVNHTNSEKAAFCSVMMSVIIADGSFFSAAPFYQRFANRRRVCRPFGKTFKLRTAAGEVGQGVVQVGGKQSYGHGVGGEHSHL